MTKTNENGPAQAHIEPLSQKERDEMELDLVSKIGKIEELREREKERHSKAMEKIRREQADVIAIAKRLREDTLQKGGI